jgi:hypothetical protein
MTRLELARAEIARRRALAEAATAGPWHQEPNTMAGRVWVSMGSRLFPKAMGRPGSMFDCQAEGDQRQAASNAVFIATNDPAHVLAVLAAADAVLDRHAGWHWCTPRANAPAYRTYTEMCPEAQAVLDLYTPQEAS